MLLRGSFNNKDTIAKSEKIIVSAIKEKLTNISIDPFILIAPFVLVFEH